MKKIWVLTLLFGSAVLLPPSAFSGDHKGFQPVAKAGQVIVTYKVECPAGVIDGVIALIKEVVAYERKNSPVLYSSSPGVWADGRIGAVDLHDSEEAMEKAFTWQAEDERWSSMYADVAAGCGKSVEDFEVSSFVAR